MQSRSLTLEQLQAGYRAKRGWIMMHNKGEEDPTANIVDEPESVGAVPCQQGGVWKIHISIAPNDMEKAIPLLHSQIRQPATPPMGIKIATKALLDGNHQSSKEVALVFESEVEASKEGREAIFLFLYSLAMKFEEAGIKPDPKPPLTVGTEYEVRHDGSKADKENVEARKYDAVIKLRENETCSYFYYRDETVVLVVEMIECSPAERARIVIKTDVDQWNTKYNPHYKHNPAKRKDDFLYGLSLEQRVGKKAFLTMLKEKVTQPTFTRAEILDLATEIKKQDGKYAHIHQQRNPKWDKFRLLFKSHIPAQDKKNFWHTATYQTGLKILKDAYYARVGDESYKGREDKVTAFIDYVRGNAPMHGKMTSTRKRRG